MTDFDDLKRKLDNMQVGDRIHSYVSARASWEVAKDAEAGMDIVKKFGLVPGLTGIELPLENLCQLVYVPKTFLTENANDKRFNILGSDELIIFNHLGEDSNAYPYELIERVIFSKDPKQRIDALIKSQEYRADVKELTLRLVRAGRQINHSRRNQELELAMIRLGEMYESEMMEERK